MRDDFAKQLVERERIHSRDHYHNYRNVRGPKGAWGDDEVGGRESMRVRYNHGYDRKSFNENLNPLRGWLRSCLGKKWDKCYSELRTKFDARSVVNNHILEHLWQDVETNTYVGEKGAVMFMDTRYTNKGEQPIKNCYKDYYVCPKDGTLKKTHKAPRRSVVKQREAEKKAKELETCRFLDAHNVLRLVDGVWYNKDMFGVDRYMFLDDTVNEDYDKVRRFANFRHDLGFEINWVGYLRADLIWSKPESAHHLRESGLVSPFFGIETFHPKAAQFIGKGWSGKHAEEWIPKLYRDIWEKSINLKISLIVGLPHEPIEEAYRYLKWWTSNPFMGSIHCQPLGIGPPPRPGMPDKRSFISKEVETLGYRFTEKHASGQWGWTSPWGTSERAAQISTEINLRLESCSRISSWHIADLANMGFSIPEILKLRGSSPKHHDHEHARSNAVKRTYIAQFKRHFSLTPD